MYLILFLGGATLKSVAAEPSPPILPTMDRNIHCTSFNLVIRGPQHYRAVELRSSILVCYWSSKI